MGRHRINCSRKDTDGDITAIGNSAKVWSRAEAIRKIEAKTEEFYVHEVGPDPVDVIVVDGPSGKYLRTTPDKSSKNNLDNLPSCS